MNLWNKQKGQVVEFQPQDVDTAPSEVEHKADRRICEAAYEWQGRLVGDLEIQKKWLESEHAKAKQHLEFLESELDEVNECIDATQPAADKLKMIAERPDKINSFKDIIESLKTEADKTPRLDEIDETQAVE
jgi:hypothetical protein